MVTHKIIMGTEVITGGRAGIEAVEVVPEASDMAAVDAAAAIAKIRDQLAASGGQKATRLDFIATLQDGLVSYGHMKLAV
jgi:hypothetical protein